MNDKEKLISLLILTDPNPYTCESESGSCELTTCTECRARSTAELLIANGVTVQEWVSVNERLPENFISVLGYMTDAGEFPPVRECYTVGNEFFFPALGDIHPVSHWREMPQPPKGE